MGDLVTLLLIGLIIFLFYYHGKKKPAPDGSSQAGEPERALRMKIATELWQKSQSAENAEAKVWLAAAQIVLNPIGLRVMNAEESSGQPERAEGAEYPVPAPGAASSAAPSFSLHSLENINLLLFLGAFLVVVSAGIFVAYNYEALSGWLKFLVVGSLAAAFYAAGLVIYLRSKIMRPAGVAFTAVGLVTLPLTGLAYYNFVARGSGPVVWFVTSLVLMAGYLAALKLTRQTYIAYLVSFTTLSLYESSIALFNLPIYWYGWGMSLTAIFLLVLGRGRWWSRSEASSIGISAHLFMPIALLLSVAMVSDSGLGQLSGNFGLAAIFYAAVTWSRRREEDGPSLGLLAMLCQPVSLAAGLWDHTTRPVLALSLMLVAFGYLLLELAFAHRLARRWRLVVGVVASLLPTAAGLLASDQPLMLTLGFAATVYIAVTFAWRLRSTGFALIAGLATLPLPWIVLRQMAAVPLSWTVVAWVYLGLAMALVGWKHITKQWSESAAAAGRLTYVLALAIAWSAAAAAGSGTLLVVSLAMAVVAVVLRYYEGSLAGLIAAVILVYIGAAQLAPVLSLGAAAQTAVWLVAGLVLYLVGTAKLLGSSDLKILRYGGMAGPVVAAALGVAADSSSLPVFSLSLEGFLVMNEGLREKQGSVFELGIGVITVSFNWLLARQNVSQTQLYTLPWSAFAAYLVYRRRAEKGTRDVLAVASLAILTLPVASQALAPDGQYYGLELVAVALGLVWLGGLLHYRLVTFWGAGTVVAEVLYQMRDVIFAVPKYLISALVGAALLAAAIILLKRKKL